MALVRRCDSTAAKVAAPLKIVIRLGGSPNLDADPRVEGLGMIFLFRVLVERETGVVGGVKDWFAAWTCEYCKARWAGSR